MNIEQRRATKTAATAVTKPISLLFFDLGTDIFIIILCFRFARSTKKKEYRSCIVCIDIVFIYIEYR